MRQLLCQCVYEERKKKVRNFILFKLLRDYAIIISMCIRVCVWAREEKKVFKHFFSINWQMCKENFICAQVCQSKNCIVFGINCDWCPPILIDCAIYETYVLAASFHWDITFNFESGLKCGIVQKNSTEIFRFLVLNKQCYKWNKIFRNFWCRRNLNFSENRIVQFACGHFCQWKQLLVLVSYIDYEVSKNSPTFTQIQPTNIRIRATITFKMFLSSFARSEFCFIVL